jgi:hypothetical protein
MQTEPEYGFQPNATVGVGAFPIRGKAGWFWPSSARYLLPARSPCHPADKSGCILPMLPYFRPC